MLKDYRGEPIASILEMDITMLFEARLFYLSVATKSCGMPLCHFQIQKKSNGFNPDISHVIIGLERTLSLIVLSYSTFLFKCYLFFIIWFIIRCF
jgi:hypothetical protein